LATSAYLNIDEGAVVNGGEAGHTLGGATRGVDDSAWTKPNIIIRRVELLRETLSYLPRMHRMTSSLIPTENKKRKGKRIPGASKLKKLRSVMGMLNFMAG
jgi:hypothetical protein